ncbi:MAG: PHP domain-containing protein [Actinomycetota bacterium]|nr:PHP domain-containing protein [Actinomycetota bacterium]
MMKVYHMLSADNLESLKNSLQNPRMVSRLTGPEGEGILDRVMVERLKRTIDFYQQIQGKIPRGYAENFIPELIKQIKSLGHVTNIEVTGSARRKKPILGDIDILVATDFNQGNFNVGRSIEFLEQLAGIDYLGAKKSQNIGNLNASFVYESRLDTDIEIIVCTRSRFMVDLFTTTGNRVHTGEVLKILERKGIDIYSRNLESEADIYHLAGLQYVPCELREGRKEISMAGQNKLPRLVEMEDIKGDLHIHSSFSDGLIDQQDLADTVKQHNYQYLALTDHSHSNIYGNGLNENRLKDKLSWVRSLNQRMGDIRILSGAEVDIKDEGMLDYDDNILKKLDIVIASMHSSFRYGCSQNTRKAVAALANPYIDFLGHPTGVVFGSRAPYSLDMESDYPAGGKV